MKRIWFNPLTHYANLIDGNKYYMRLYQYEFVPIYCKWIAASNTFLNDITSQEVTIDFVNRVSPAS